MGACFWLLCGPYRWLQLFSRAYWFLDLRMSKKCILSVGGVRRTGNIWALFDSFDLIKQTLCENSLIFVYWAIQSEPLSSVFLLFFLSLPLSSNHQLQSCRNGCTCCRYLSSFPTSCMMEVLRSFRGEDAQVRLCILHPHTIQMVLHLPGQKHFETERKCKRKRCQAEARWWGRKQLERDRQKWKDAGLW